MITIGYEVVEPVGPDFKVSAVYVTIHKQTSLSQNDRVNVKYVFLNKNLIIEFSETRQRVCLADFPETARNFIEQAKKFVIVEISTTGMKPYEVSA